MYTEKIEKRIGIVKQAIVKQVKRAHKTGKFNRQDAMYCTVHIIATAVYDLSMHLLMVRSNSIVQCVGFSNRCTPN